MSASESPGFQGERKKKKGERMKEEDFFTSFDKERKGSELFLNLFPFLEVIFLFCFYLLVL